MKNSIFRNTANHTLKAQTPYDRRSRKSTIPNSIRKSVYQMQNNRNMTTNTTESALNEDSDYILHPQILSNLKVDKGSIESFMKKDDLQSMLDVDNDDYDSNFIISKIDRIGLVGKEARMKMKIKEEEKRK